MSKIVVIGLGPGDIGLLTLNAIEKIKNGNKIFLRTDKHEITDFLKENKIEYYSYDYTYIEKENFDDVYKYIAMDLVNKANEYGIINYCVPGHPIIGEETTNYLLKHRANSEIEIEIVQGLSFIDTTITSIENDILDGLKIVDGLEIDNVDIDINCDNLITQVYDNSIASEVKISLIDIYGDDYDVFVINNGISKKIELYKLDRIDEYNHMTCIYLPKMKYENRNSYNMYNLIKIMEKLRSKEGCPWDIKADHKSLREFIIEEAYEVVDAINSEDVDSLVEELGDVLLQVVFHSVIGKEDGYFNITDVITKICNKMINRHPHVFKNLKVDSVEEVLSNWNDIKDKEKNIKSYTERLESIPKVFPSLSKSYKIQKIAAEVGFDWPDIDGAKLKFEEEYKELLEGIRLNDNENIEEEVGDLIFAIVNFSRFLNVNPEVALNNTINKFINRFRFIEEQSVLNGKDLQKMTLEEMDSLWNMAKIHKN